jgi:diguanylate cyclase (GGDEF)-like protein
LLLVTCGIPCIPLLAAGGHDVATGVRSEELPVAGFIPQRTGFDASLPRAPAPYDRTWVYATLLIAGLLTGLTGLAFIKFYALSRSLQSEILARRALEEELRELAVTDPGTELMNRRGLFHAIEQALALGTSPLSLLVIDLDHFKKVNDTYGHACGDRVLREFAGVCREIARPGDAVGRLGGEEFAIVLPGTGLYEARRIAERIRETVERRVTWLPKGGAISVTVSLGLALHRQGEALDALMSRADGAMYEAKCLGRNRVVVAADFDQTARLELQRQKTRGRSRHPESGGRDDTESRRNDST